MGDRIATAAVSLVAAAVTVAIIGLLVFFAGPVETPRGLSTFLLLGAFVVGLAGVGGFIAGPKRMAQYFGVVWGTEQPNLKQAAVVTLIVLIICAYVYVRA